MRKSILDRFTVDEVAEYLASAPIAEWECACGVTDLDVSSRAHREPCLPRGTALPPRIGPDGEQMVSADGHPLTTDHHTRTDKQLASTTEVREVRGLLRASDHRSKVDEIKARLMADAKAAKK